MYDSTTTYYLGINDTYSSPRYLPKENDNVSVSHVTYDTVVCESPSLLVLRTARMLFQERRDKREIVRSSDSDVMVDSTTHST